jgi:hypothetical protein
MHKPVLAYAVTIALLCAQPAAAARPQKTSLMREDHLAAIAAEASGSLAKDTVARLTEMHRVHGTAGFREAADYVAAKAREYGLENVAVESFPADGKTAYGTFRSYYGWEADSAVLEEVSPRAEVVADYSKLRVALADYSNDADVTAELVDAGAGTSDADYAGKDVRGKIVLAGGNVATAHREAVEERGAAGLLSYQPNQTTGWSGDFPDNVRWGHLSPYNLKNTFAFMISLRAARAYRDRLARGEAIRLRALVKSRMRPASFDVVTATIPGADPAAGEVLYSCHLCHQKPGANDNASGAAVILEDARLLSSLVRSGRLPRPRRTIRFIWPPEIAGTQCYLSRHPEVARNAKAAIHMDMVGGSFAATKATFHLTRTPASLPSYVNDVAAVFGEYVIEGSRRAAAEGDFADALLAPDGSKEMLVAEVAPHSMGSDHDVLQEGTYRIPTIYMNDWPDVFIHTHNDTLANIDATKLRRVAVIGAASGYFLASAGAEEARSLAAEVFARGGARLGEAFRRALARSPGSAYAPDELDEAENVVAQAARQERAALESVLTLAPGDAVLRATVDAMTANVRKREEEARLLLVQVRPIAAGQTARRAGLDVIPRRSPSAAGPLSVYYYDYFEDRRIADVPGDGRFQYEALNLVDGRRTLGEIRDVLDGSYGPTKAEDVVRYFEILEKAGVVSLERK